MQYLDSSLPVDFSQRSRIQIDIKTTQERIIEKNKPEEGPALTPEEKKLKDMLDDLAKKKNIQVKAKLHLEIVALLLDMERKEEAIEELRFIVKNYNNKTPVQSGKAAMMLSDIYLEQEDYSKWRLYLNQIIDKKLQGNGEGHILYALESLRDHYLKEEKENMAIPYMKKIAEQYPGQNGQRAAKNLFNIVDIEIQKENFLQAMSLLREIRDEYPGHENVYANKAKKMLVEIKEAHPHLGSLEERSVYAFLNTIRFKSEDRSYLEAKKTISSISKMKSFTFTGWFNQTLMSSRFQVLFSRWNGVGRGVVIGLQSGAVVVMTGDGYQTTTHKTDPFGTSKWFHLAVTLDAGLGKLTVYVDGLNAYEANEVVVENVGAGKTRLGKISLDEDGFYGGRMQFVELHSKVLWSEPFDATKKFIDPKEAIFALEGFEGGLKDLKKNSWYNSNVNKQNQ